MTTFYANLAKYRRPQENDRQFAIRIGANPADFYHYKRGTVPRYEKVKSIAEKLSANGKPVTVADLMEKGKN